MGAPHQRRPRRSGAFVEADHVDDIQRFLRPGFKSCTATVTPVSEVPVPKG
jgi:hypothetical protein